MKKSSLFVGILVNRVKQVKKFKNISLF